MAKTTIEWCDFTFNPWRGCTKVSAGCANCYADTLSKRNPKVLGVWGPNGTRVRAADGYWRQPLTWDRWARDGVCPACGGKDVRDTPGQCTECNGSGRVEPYRARVFCASLADVFEGPETMPADYAPFVELWRDNLFALIALTPHLDWLLLTKRPQHAAAYLTRMADPDERQDKLDFWISETAMENSNPHARRKDDLRATAPLADELAWPLPNVWVGTSIEDQKTADERIPHLLRCPAAVRFLSCEPLLGSINLARLRPGGVTWMDCLEGREHIGRGIAAGGPRVDWVIVGGESGAGEDTRPMHPGWVRRIRDDCLAAGVAFHFKQWGEWRPVGSADDLDDAPGFAGADEDRTACVYPDGTSDANGAPDRAGYFMKRVGKKAAGRLLDGRTWDEFPASATAAAAAEGGR